AVLVSSLSAGAGPHRLRALSPDRTPRRRHARAPASGHCRYVAVRGADVDGAAVGVRRLSRAAVTSAVHYGVVVAGADRCGAQCHSAVQCHGPVPRLHRHLLLEAAAARESERLSPATAQAATAQAAAAV